MVLVSLVAAAPPAPVVYFDPSFEAALSDPEAVLSRERVPIAVAGGATIHDCRGLAEHASELAALREDRRFTDYAICFAVEAIAHAQPPARGVAGEAANNPATTLRARLDLASFASSLRPRLPRGKAPLTPAQSGLKFITPTRRSLSLADPDWVFRIDVLAAADFDHRGGTQWMAHIADRAKQGSYFAAGYLIIDGVDAAGVMRARWLDGR